ncbi:META domain-containing protein [Panacibacter sp. DH6]|uniref:META domain-containing protein n=1 Tax=Panacibacter microcysteis TaxID=2793269 RepID=A0A931GZH4_9BACT|nr:META domain-containing protein [Panacibacter microcysteis]MBG9378214.1 META domain-containing protein [Panacibacter microcysteis]
MKTLFCAAAITSMLCISACSNTKNTVVDNNSAASATPANDIAGKKWKLVELMGQPVADSINGKLPFITFNKADSTYAANGGCNGMGGKIKWNALTMSIKFKQGMSTMMACPDMTVENGLKNVFDAADNYTVNDSVLSLNKARMAPLARFRKINQ